MMVMYAGIFILFLIGVVYPLGKLVLWLCQLKWSSPLVLIFSGAVGLLVLSLELLVFGLIGHLGFYPIYILIQSIGVFIVLFKHQQLLIPLRKQTINPLVLSVIAVVISINSLIIVPYGLKTSQGLSLPGAHYVDATWHLSLIRSLQRSIPPENPLLAGVPLTNYHYLVDLQFAATQSITRIPLENLYFQHFPVLYLLLFCGALYVLAKRMTNSQFGGVMAVLLIGLSSNWYYLAQFLYPSARSTPSVAWADFYSTKLVNYSLLFSLIILFLCIYLLFFELQKNRRVMVLTGVCLGSLIAIKSHTAVVTLMALFPLALFDMTRKKFHLFLILLISGGVSGILLLVTQITGSSGLIIAPLWLVKTMYETTDHLNSVDWELRRQFLLSNNSYLGIIKLYSEGLLSFFLINLGVLISGVLIFLQSANSQLNRLKVFLILLLISGSLTSLVLLFTYLPMNTIQFFYLAIVSSSLLFSWLLVWINRKYKYLGAVIGIIVWFSLLPGVWLTMQTYTQAVASTSYSAEVVDSLQFLNSLPESIVVSEPYFTSNSIIGGYSNHRSFLANDVAIGLFDTPEISLRKQIITDIFSCNNQRYDVLDSYRPVYLFLRKSSDCPSFQNTFPTIFENSQIVIYKL